VVFVLHFHIVDVSSYSMTTFHVITLFPDSLDSYIKSSIVARAIKDKKIAVKTYNPRDYVKDKNHRVDQKPYGGGPGMVIEALPVIKAIVKAKGKKKKVKIIFFAPAGKQFDTEYAQGLAKNYKDIIFVCGRYEGIDVRVKEAFPMDDLSIGPYVITGGELAALLVLDCTARQIPGVLGDFSSREEARVSSGNVYTRPEVIVYKKKKYSVPKVLLSGDHKKIEQWKKNLGKE